MNCEGDEGPALTMVGGIAAFGGHSLGGLVERSATLTAKDARLGMESETFSVHPGEDVAGTLRSTDRCADVDHGMAKHLVAGSLQSSGKAAGSATQQDSESGVLVVHGTQDQCISEVRRLTPVECEQLQGFPEGYTLMPWRGKRAADCPDGPRYKAIGNSKAGPVVRWLGLQILEQI